MPQPPKQLSEVLDKINGGGNVNLAELETYNNKANDEYNDSALIRCDYCNRTFLPERLGIHRKICTPEKPFKPLPPSNTGKSSMAPTSTSTSASTTKGFGGGSTGYSEQPKSSAMGRGGAGAGSGLKKPSAQPQYEEYNDDDDDNGYVPAKPTPKTQPVSKPSAQPKTQSYGGGGGYGNPVSEYADVQLVDCDICGRRFAADRIDRHIKACTKSQKGEAKHAKKVALAEKKQAETEKFIAKEAKFKKNNWRDQHNEFVANLKYNRKLKAVEEQGGDIRSLGPPPKMSAIESNMIECPYCARKFNPQSAEKHINICKNVVNKPKAVPGKAIPTKTSTQAPMRSSQAGFGGTPTKPTTTKTTASASKYGGGSYGTYDSLDNEYQASYNPTNYGGPSSMSQARQTGFKDQPMQKPGLSSQYGAQPNSSRGVQPNSGRGSTQYGAGSQTGMNSSSRGGFGTKSTSSSLANAGKMAMQDYTNYNSPPSTKAAKTGYRY